VRHCVDFRRAPLLERKLSAKDRQALEDPDTGCPGFRKRQADANDGSLVKLDNPVPEGVSVFDVEVPLLERELWLSDVLSGGAAKPDQLERLSLRKSYGTVVSGSQTADDRYRALVVQQGRGVGLYTESNQQAVHSSSKGAFLKKELLARVAEERRVVVFTHLKGACGYDGLRRLLLEIGLQEHQAGLSALPYEMFGCIDPKKDSEIRRKLLEDFNEGLFSTMLVLALSEGIDLDNVQYMYITEPTSNPATWTQETARVARLGSFQKAPYYVPRGRKASPEKHPHIFQLVSVVRKPASRWLRAGELVSYVPIAALMLAITSVWTLAIKPGVESVPALLRGVSPTDKQKASRHLEWAQQSSLGRVPGSEWAFSVGKAVLSGDSAQVQRRVVKEGIMKKLLAANVLQTFVALMLMRHVSWRAIVRWARTAAELVTSAFPSVFPELPAQVGRAGARAIGSGDEEFMGVYEEGAIAARVTGRTRVREEEEIVHTFDEHARQKCTDGLADLERLDLQCKWQVAEQESRHVGEDQLVSFRQFVKKWSRTSEVPHPYSNNFHSRGRAARLLKAMRKDQEAPRLLAYMAPGTGKSILAWECVLDTIQHYPRGSLSRVEVLYLTTAGTEDNFLREGMNAVLSILAERKNLVGEGLDNVFFGAVWGILDTLLDRGQWAPTEVTNTWPRSEAKVPLDLRVVHYEDRGAAISSLEASAQAQQKESATTVRCVILDEVHHALDIQDDQGALDMEDALEAQRGPSPPALLLCLTGTLPSVEAFCTVSSLVRPDSRSRASIRLLSRTECTRNFADASVAVKVVAKIFKVVVPVIKLTLPAVEWLRGNSVVTALVGFFTTAYLVAFDMERWEALNTSWDARGVVASVLDRLVYAPEVVRAVREVIPAPASKGEAPLRRSARANLAAVREVTEPRRFEEAAEEARAAARQPRRWFSFARGAPAPPLAADLAGAGHPRG